RGAAHVAPPVSRAGAVFTRGRVAQLVAALAAGEVHALRDAMEDRLHQPQRFAVVPSSRVAYDAALDAGAWCAWLSGSGPTVAALCSVDAAESVAASLPPDTRTDQAGAQREP